MQRNQELHKDAGWQDKMVEIEMRILHFYHLMIEKR